MTKEKEELTFEEKIKLLEEIAYSQGYKEMFNAFFDPSLKSSVFKGEKVLNMLGTYLLDDVLSELDEQRQKKLMELVSDDVQCMITATEIPAFLKAAHPASYTVTDGKVEKTDGGRA